MDSARPRQPLLKTPSPRELEIARLLVERWSDKEIAERTQMGVGTVHTHLNRMRRKSGLHDWRALGAWAMGARAPGQE